MSSAWPTAARATVGHLSKDFPLRAFLFQTISSPAQMPPLAHAEASSRILSPGMLCLSIFSFLQAAPFCLATIAVSSRLSQMTMLYFFLTLFELTTQKYCDVRSV